MARCLKIVTAGTGRTLPSADDHLSAWYFLIRLARPNKRESPTVSPVVACVGDRLTLASGNSDLAGKSKVELPWFSSSSGVVALVFEAMRDVLRRRALLQMEVLALRHQLTVWQKGAVFTLSMWHGRQLSPVARRQFTPGIAFARHPTHLAA